MIGQKIKNTRMQTGWLCLVFAVSLSACGGGSGQGPTTNATTQNGSSVIVTNTTGQNNQGTQSGANSTSIGAANGDGYFPDANGHYPNALGIYPDKDGRYPSSAEAGFFANDQGVARAYSVDGPIDDALKAQNVFFKAFGNGRSCASCHRAEEGFSITPQSLHERFVNSAGEDAIFQVNDGANSPLAKFATLDEKEFAFSMLLTKGLIRVGMKIPDNAEFELVKVDDPYHFSSPQELSLFRRPLASANLRFLSEVMWDGRETTVDSKGSTCLPNGTCFASLDQSLAKQAHNATLGHAQAAQGLSQEEQAAVLKFEKSLISTQIFDREARFLDVAGARGGPNFLINTTYYFGINDLNFGNIKTGAAFNPNVMQNFSAWLNASGNPNPQVDAKRRAIARGEQLFNTRTFNPLNDGTVLNDLKIPSNRVTCSACHNTPQVGSASTPFAANIFTTIPALRTPDQVLFTLRNKKTGMLLKTLDPGVAMTSGRWEDIGRFKVPSLRGLSARPPYFHDGSAESIFDVVSHYDRTFSMQLTGQEITDLVAFLGAL